MGKSECKSDRKSDPRKTNLSLSADMLDEIRAAAKHHDASLSWVMQQAWMIARGEIAKMPPAPRRRAVQPCAQTHTMTAAPPRDLPPYRPPDAPKATPTPEPARPADTRAAPYADPLDVQWAPRWDDVGDGPTM